MSQFGSRRWVGRVVAVELILVSIKWWVQAILDKKANYLRLVGVFYDPVFYQLFLHAPREIVKHSLCGCLSMQLSQAWLTNGFPSAGAPSSSLQLSVQKVMIHRVITEWITETTKGFFIHNNIGANWRRKLNEGDFDCERSDVIKHIYLGIDSYWCDVLLFFTGTLHHYELVSYRDLCPLGQWVLDLSCEDKLSWLLPTTMGWSWWLCPSGLC